MACRGSGVRVSLAPLNEYPVTDRDISGLHQPLFNAKQLNIIFVRQMGGKWVPCVSPEQLLTVDIAVRHSESFASMQNVIA